MYSRVLTAGLQGLECELVWTEVDTENGLPAFTVVGLASQSVKEAKDRIRSAIVNSSFSFPSSRVTVNLTPAAKKKEGSHFDLPIAVSTLLCTSQIVPKVETDEFAFMGELTLDGRVEPVDGVLPMAIGLRRMGIRKFVIPVQNSKEISLVKDVEAFPVKSLVQLCRFLEGKEKILPVSPENDCFRDESSLYEDFSDIRGQSAAKRAAQVAVAGFHGLLMIGPPGVGKSMIGRRIPGLMPPISYEQKLECTQIYSVAGLLSPERPLVDTRPFRSPHHTMSATSMTGGGMVPKPGEVSLAHNGVLFLDELPEFSSKTLETLRQPMEDGEITIVRTNGRCSFPSKFMLVAAMNPCRCGYFGDPVKPCTCTESDRQKYIGKVSGPLLDRIDIHSALERPAYGEISSEFIANGPCTLQMREAVIAASEIQRERYKNTGISWNSKLTPQLIKKYCSLDDACKKLMESAFGKWNLSARSYHKIIKVARTIADLDLSENIREEHILEALSYRLPEKFFR